MTQYENLGSVGYYQGGGFSMVFEVGDANPVATETTDSTVPVPYLPMPMLLTVGGTRVLSKGIDNLLPDNISSLFGTNRFLPELFDKLYRILYGKGLFVYKQEFEKGKLFRNWQTNETIENWLGDWQKLGLSDSVEQYIEKIIKDSYYFEDYGSKWRFLKGRRIGRMPVAGLEHIENRRFRLGTSKVIGNSFNSFDYVDSDFNRVVVGNWGIGGNPNMKTYPRLRLNNVHDYTTAVAYHKHHTPGQIYGMNKFYFGIKEWLIGTNRNPIYINSYLENSLSARIHVIIPGEWVEEKKEMLQETCNHNVTLKEEGKNLIKPNGIDIGTEFHEALMDAYIKAEMRNLTNFMSGQKNQGKTWTSFKYTTADGGTSAWEIIPIDMKYLDYIKGLVTYDKRADEVITSSIGIDSSISNISKDGVISKSGADAYYNYIIHLHANLPTAERVSCEDLNWALQVNFPSLYKQGYRIGLYNDIPSRQEDQKPEDRLSNQMNGITQMLMTLKQELSEQKTTIQNGNNN